ncbi:MAG: hypothetical protein GY854_22785 [Deltaproteobacteria bacterium]|nr:hypothetical protein [Deltaproteobacteria bacterium]
MRNLIIPIALFLISFMFFGCATASWINDISVSPDGKRIDVVGAQMKQTYGGWYVNKPLRWVCVRDEAGALQCRHMTKDLPRMD